MTDDDVAHDGQAQARALPIAALLTLDAIESLRQARQVLARHARPTLVTMIARSRFEVLRKAHPQAALSAWLLDQPVERQLRLLRAVVPERKRVGLLLGGNIDAEAALHAAAAGFGLSTSSRPVLSALSWRT